MLKLQDFAAQQGVTDRQIQRLLKKYENEVEGFFERKGPNGTWLSEDCCEILRGKMKSQPLAIYEEDPQLEELRQENQDLRRKLDAANEDFRRYAAGTATALAQASELQLLAERSESNRRRAEQAEQRAAEAERDAETAHCIVEATAQEKAAAEERAAEECARAEAAERQVADLQEQLHQIASASWRQRRKLLKDLAKKSKV